MKYLKCSPEDLKKGYKFIKRGQVMVKNTVPV